MNSLPTSLLGIAGLIVMLVLASWILGWDSYCDLRCWEWRVGIMR